MFVRYIHKNTALIEVHNTLKITQFRESKFTFYHYPIGKLALQYFVYINEHTFCQSV